MLAMAGPDPYLTTVNPRCLFLLGSISEDITGHPRQQLSPAPAAEPGDVGC